ncbi:MAG TPA: HK97 family phage prohead protease [Gammaproteobacteria bacterium]
MTKTLQTGYGIEIKRDAVSAAGEFHGYAATFDEDRVGDRIAPGAFRASLDTFEKSGSMPALLWQHDWNQPIGRWLKFAEDSRGLRAEGKLTLDVQRAKDAHALMRDGALYLSIGYRVPPGGAAYERDKRTLKAIDLLETSLVSVPANPNARVTGVKSFHECESVRDFEALVREALGMSAREAKRLAAVAWPALRSDDSEELAGIAAELKRITESIQPTAPKPVCTDPYNRFLR